MKKTDYPKSGHSEAIYSLREIFGHFGHLFGPFLTISQNPLCSRGLRYYGMILLYIWVRFIHFPPLVNFSLLKTPSRHIIPIWPLPALLACLCVCEATCIFGCWALGGWALAWRGVGCKRIHESNALGWDAPACLTLPPPHPPQAKPATNSLQILPRPNPSALKVLCSTEEVWKRIKNVFQYTQPSKSKEGSKPGLCEAEWRLCHVHQKNQLQLWSEWKFTYRFWVRKSWKNLLLKYSKNKITSQKVLKADFYTQKSKFPQKSTQKRSQKSIFPQKSTKKIITKKSSSKKLLFIELLKKRRQIGVLKVSSLKKVL